MTTTSHRRTALVAALLASSALAAPAQAADKTITIATHYNQEQMAPLLACFDQYEAENPGTEIVFQQASYRDFLQTIMTARVGGTSPDIYNIYSIWAPQLADAGTLAEPPADIAEFVNANYGEGTVGAATINGTLYGIPTELSVYQLFYNKKILAEAGYDAPPATWDELAEIAAKVTKKNDQGNITVAGYTYGPSVANAVHVFYSQMFAAGVAPYSDDFRKTNFLDPEAIRIVERQGKLFADGSTSNSVTTDDFAANGAAMAIMANWQKSSMMDAFGDEFENTVGIAPIPHDGGDPGTMLYSFFWAVDSASKHPEESWALLEWLNSQRDGGLSCTGQMLNDLGALTGNLGDLEAMETDDSFTKPFVDAIESGAAKSQPNIWQASENDRILRSYIEKVWAGQMSAEDALSAADAEVTAILAEQDY
ncbi:carbohydrate ABC transporter substrate-binding protein (CUT1 family) [Aliiruegeria haliotis]|uniref:Carbohydrate ABC transporter substrate-binding protein (CUT1 family) n=1 Tax=Aliiruegeria haliotis TaxID=1280846 RepID=A0A2T0REA2_9RHOB|nr:extracellular solute-binding protein [Aliiruegeria haliotis]PRY19526.1 carbohydrate ABC transporter substrate-binding protein (CUT1 family) [Aliiruegeria haliotis]